MLVRVLISVFSFFIIGCASTPSVNSGQMNEPRFASEHWWLLVSEGRLHLEDGNFESAAQFFQEAVNTLERDKNHDWRLGLSLYYLGDTYFTYPPLSSPKETEELLERAARLTADLSGKAELMRGVILFRLGRVIEIERNPVEAEGLIEEGKAIFKKHLGPRHPLIMNFDQAFNPIDIIHPEEILIIALTDIEA